MKVKRVSSFRYEVEDAKYISIDKHYITNTLSSYELEVKNIHSPWQKDRIKLFYKLQDLKDFLAKYDSERELLADYYMAKLEGKFTL